jgi:hypothetical protein
LKTSNINVDLMRKINYFKNDVWKVERVPKTFKNLNSFLDDVENAKNDANILKIYFFGFLLFFAIFGFFKNFIEKEGKKLGNNRCPLFTMLTKQNSSMFCIVSFVKKRKGKWSHYLGQLTPFEEKWSIFRGDQSTHSHWSIFTGDLPTQTLTLVYFQGWPPTHTESGLFSEATSPHTHAYPSLFSWATYPSRKRKNGLIVIGNLPRRKNGLIVMGDPPR